MALKRSMSPSIPIPVPVQRPHQQHQFVSCSLESALSMPTMSEMNISRRWNDGPFMDTFPSSMDISGAGAYCDMYTESSNILMPHQEEHHDPFSGPPVQPAYIEKRWCLTSTCAADTLMDSLRKVLCSGKMSVDMDMENGLDPAPWRLSGLAFEHGCAVRFCVSVFTASTTDGLNVVEVQRRAGDCIAFHAFFYSLFEYCSNSVPLATMLPAAPSSHKTPAWSPLEVSSNPATSPVSAESLRSLVNMMSSEYMDVRLEALNTLVKVARSAHRVLASDQACQKSLRRCLNDADPQVVRCAIAVLSQLCEDEHARFDVIGAQSMEPLVSLLHSRTPQIARHAAKILFRLSKSHPARLHLSPRSLRHLQSLALNASDATVLDLVSRALQQLENIGGVSVAVSPQRSLPLDSRAPLSV